MRFKDLTGQVFGRLTAKSMLQPLRPGDGFRWVCACSCGNECIVKTRLLTYKKGTRSCGCILAEVNKQRPHRNSTNLKHGHTSRRISPEYVTWASMIQRCSNPKHVSYKNYGARGVSVCPEWVSSFEQFLADMGPRPANTSIERIDNALGYSRQNCRWASSVEQACNRRDNVTATAFGVTRSCTETSALFQIPTRNIYRWAQEGRGDIGARITAWKERAKSPALVGQ